MRRIVGVLLVLCVMIVGLMNVAAAADKLVIGAAMPNFDDKWLSYMYDGMRAEAAKHPEVELIMTDARLDPARQLSQVENFVVQGVDAIIVCPEDIESAGMFIKRANEANIPIVFVNRPPAKDLLDKIACYVGSESIVAGTIQMEKVAEMLDGKGRVCVLTGVLGHESQIMRTKGNYDVAEKFPELEIIREATGEYQRAEGMQVMENWLQAEDKIDAIVSNNDEMAIGAILAAEAAGRAKDILFAGIDATPDALEFVKAGRLQITVFQDAFGQGGGSVDAAYRIANGEELDKMYWIPYELVTKENCEEYIKKWQ